MASVRQVAATLEVRLLGSVCAYRGRPLPIRGGRPLALLAALALHAGDRVSLDELGEAVWGDHAPAHARHALHVFVSTLRGSLGAAAIENERGSYRLAVEPGSVDAIRFRSILRGVNGGAPETTLATLDEALALWRGTALDGAAESPFLRAVAAGLEEERLGAVERRAEIALELGRSAELVGELTELVAANPVRERLRALLMTALYREGRQADALASYREGRALLASELGIEPSRMLRDLEQAILRQDAGLLAGDEPANGGRAVEDEDRLIRGAAALALSWRASLRDRDEAAYAAVDERYPEVMRALDLAIARGRRREAMQMVGGLWIYWIVRGHHEEGDRRCRAALALPGEEEAETEMEGVIGASEIARVRAEWARAAELKERALVLAAAVDDARCRPALLADLGHVWIHLGDLEAAERFAHEAVRLRRGATDESSEGVGHALLALGEVREYQGRLDEAVDLYEESIELWSQCALGGEVAYIRGRLLGRALRRAGKLGAAYSAYRQALSEARRLHDVSTTSAAIQGLAWVALERGDHAGAVRGLASIANDDCQSTLEAHEREWYEADLRRARAVVPPQDFAAAWAVGAASPCARS